MRYAKPAPIIIPTEPIVSIPRPADLVRTPSRHRRLCNDTSSNRDTAFARIGARVTGFQLAEKLIGARGS